MKKISKFFEPLWRKLLLVVVLAAVSYAAFSQTPLNFNKPSSAASSTVVIYDVTAMYKPLDNKITLYGNAYDSHNHTPVQLKFRIKPKGEYCSNAKTTDVWLNPISSYSLSGQKVYTYQGTLPVTRGKTYVYAAKARNGVGEYSGGFYFCSDSWLSGVKSWTGSFKEIYIP